MAEWIWDAERRCWDGEGGRIYATHGCFVIADSGGWQPGSYDSRAAAEMALGRDNAFLQALQDRKNEQPWGADRVITVADLTDEKES